MERKTARRIVLTAVFLIALAGAACLGLVTCGSNTPFEGLRTSALNTLLDQTGMKQRLESELYAKADEVAQQTGIPVELIDSGIEMLDLKSWQAATLPEDAAQTASFDLSEFGQNAQITTYDDLSYVTVDAYGQSVTFKIPESAEVYTQAAPLVNGAADAGLLDLLQL